MLLLKATDSQANTHANHTLYNCVCENEHCPHSATIERVFSMWKDILKPKRTGLSNAHFEMLLFLKANNQNK